jgi:hypothetical protein
MNKEFVSRQQLDLLPERLRKAEETDATKELNFYIGDLYKKNKFVPMNIMVVGAGGSYPAAILAKHALHDEMCTPNVDAVTPQTAIRIFTQFDNIVNCDWHPKYDLVIGISYSGKTPDIKSVSELCVKKGYPFVLLTGAEKSQLSDIYQESDSIKIISYFNATDTTGKERGMISMVSTLAPAIIFDDNWTCKLIPENQEALVTGEKFVSGLNIPDIAKSIKQYPTIHVFYEWDTLPTATDIESKFTEAGIANVILHEKKNFSHGRYTSLYNQNFAVVINLTRYDMTIQLNGSDINKFYKSKYDENLAKFLNEICKKNSAYYIEIGTVAMMPAQWNIEAMTKLPFLITAIGEELGIDISKPLNPLPEEAIMLYDYKGEF